METESPSTPASTQCLTQQYQHWVAPIDARDQVTGKWRVPTDAEVWDMVAGSERLLKREVRRLLPKRRAREFDVMYSNVVVSRALSIMATFDPEHPKRASWITHMVANARWYAYKFVHGKNGHWKDIKRDVIGSTVGAYALAFGTAGTRVRSCDVETSRSPLAPSEQESRLRVRVILDLLSPDLASIVEWRVLHGFDYDEVASHLNLSRARVKRMYEDAIRQLREAAWREGPAGEFVEALRDELNGS